MEEKPLVEIVCNVIRTLHHDPDCTKKNEADRWLSDFQKTIDAWSIADELLQKTTDTDCCYFGAHMMRNKIIYSFNELPQDKVLQLHSSLMQKLIESTEKTENVIITQLCVAVVDLSLQMTSWKDPIYTFLNKCNEIPCEILLEILRLFPEEVDTKQIRLGSNRRCEIQDALTRSAGLLNDYLKQLLSQDSSPMLFLKAMKCYSSWVSVIKDVSVIVDCILLPKVFEILTDPPIIIYNTSNCIESRVHDTASDLLCNIFRSLRTDVGADILNPNLLSKIAAFENAYHTSVARESDEKSINYCRIFSDLGEAFIPMMVRQTKRKSPHYSLQALDLILICVGHHDYEVSSITFNFWFTLAETLYHSGDDGARDEFKPYVNRLLIALCRQVQIDPDHLGLLEDSDDFKSFREKVFDLVRDIVFVVGATRTFCQIFSSMQNCESTWEQTEANLFIMYAVAWKISLDENTVIPKLLESVMNMPQTTHIALKYTAILIMGQICDWFDEHPDYLILVLQFLESNLKHEELSEAAASSMHAVCYAARKKLKDQFTPLLTILKKLHSYNLNNKASIAILKGVTAVMTYLTSEDITVAAREICSLQIYPLQSILENHAADSTPFCNTNINPIPWLDRLSAIFRFVEQPEPNNSHISNEVRCACAPVFAEVQPVLFQIMDRFQNDVAIMERCCRCIRFAIRALGKTGVFLLPKLVEKLVELYRLNGHSCFLYLGSILVDEHGFESSNWQIILQMVDAFIEPSFALLQNQNCFQDHPDTIDDLFRLCSRILQRMPIVFLLSNSVWPLLKCGVAAISLSHREANSSVMKFFHEMFDLTKTDDPTFNATKREAVNRIYEQIGEELLHKLIHASVFELPSYTIADLAEVLFDLIQFNPKTTLKWMELAIQKLPNQNPSGSLMASPEQIVLFLKTCEQATRVRDVSNSLKEFTLYYS